MDNPSEEIEDEALETVEDDPNNPQETEDGKASDAERIKAQLKGSKDEAILMGTALRVAAKPDLLLDMPRAEAEKVIKRLYKDGLATTTDYDEVIESLRPNASKGAKKKSEDGGSDKESIIQEAMKRIEEKQARERMDSSVAKALKGYDKESREKILEEFREVSEGKKWTTERAIREVEKIALYMKKDSDSSDARTDAYARMANMSKGKSSP